MSVLTYFHLLSGTILNRYSDQKLFNCNYLFVHFFLLTSFSSKKPQDKLLESHMIIVLMMEKEIRGVKWT